ncbi:MAG TPA: hypothetical protein VHZ55_07460 [Bryobacteraceae bacterium]|jgi:hypothetical protein|nr:hypothetical protein [Bryobacteraceae bacterium]
MAAASHPDTELLAALAEATLPTPEHDALMRHVSHCQRCRACLLFLASTQPQTLRVWGFPYRSVAAVLCIVPLLTIVLFITQHKPHYALPETYAPVLPPGLLNVSLALPSQSFYRRFPINSGPRPSSSFELTFQTHIVVQTERGERWLTLVNPLARAKRN